MWTSSTRISLRWLPRHRPITSATSLFGPMKTPVRGNAALAFHQRLGLSLDINLARKYHIRLICSRRFRVSPSFLSHSSFRYESQCTPEWDMGNHSQPIFLSTHQEWVPMHHFGPICNSAVPGALSVRRLLDCLSGPRKALLAFPIRHHLHNAL